MLQNVEHKQAEETKDNAESVPLFSIGLIADPQYADAPNGKNYTKTRTRRYRQALQLTQNAIKTWNDAAECKIRPYCVICLGDIVDLLNVKNKTSFEAMNTMMQQFNQFKPFNPSQLQQNIDKKRKIYSCNTISRTIEFDDIKPASLSFGTNAKYPFFHNCNANHEIYNFDRKRLSLFQFCSAYDKNQDDFNYYYSFSPFDGWLFIVLDGFAVSTHGYEYCKNVHPNYKLATDLLKQYNVNQNKNIPPKVTDNPEIKDPQIARYCAYNGGFGAEQLEWFEGQLKIAEKEKDKVIVLSHIPIVSTKKCKDILAWDYVECKGIVDKYCKQIKMFISGHEHDGDRMVDKNGVVHMTMEGIVEAPENTDCFATAYFYKDKLKIKGYGIIKDIECSF